jgi:hypothetical protein
MIDRKTRLLGRRTSLGHSQPLEGQLSLPEQLGTGGVLSLLGPGLYSVLSKGRDDEREDAATNSGGARGSA